MNMLKAAQAHSLTRTVSNMHSLMLQHAGDPSLSAQDLPPGSLSWTLSCDDEYIVTAFQQPAHRPCWGYRVREADRWVPRVGCFAVALESFSASKAVLSQHAESGTCSYAATAGAVKQSPLPLGRCLGSHLFMRHGA